MTKATTTVKNSTKITSFSSSKWSPSISPHNKQQQQANRSSLSTSTTQQEKTTESSSSLQEFDLHPMANYIIRKQPILLFVIGSGGIKQAGFGSITMNLLLLVLYFYDINPARKLVVDESYCGKYRLNKTHGIYTSYFQRLGFPVLRNSKQEYSLIKQQVIKYYETHHDQRRDMLSTSLLSLSSSNTSISSSTISRYYSQVSIEDLIKSPESSPFWKFSNDPSWYTKKWKELPWNEQQYRQSTYALPIIKVTQQYYVYSFKETRRMALKYYHLWYASNNIDKNALANINNSVEKSIDGNKTGNSRISTTAWHSNNTQRNIDRISSSNSTGELRTTSMPKKRQLLILFFRMSNLVCTIIQPTYNQFANEKIQTLLESQNESQYPHPTIPSMISYTQAQQPSASSSSDSLSVAFHIRRGIDKSTESRFYHSEEYVRVLVDNVIVPNNQKFNKGGSVDSDTRYLIQYCFVATDDYDVVFDELRLSLLEHNIPCTLYALRDTYHHRDHTGTSTGSNVNDANVSSASGISSSRSSTSSRRDAYDMILLLAEMKYLIDATYFVGTFNSNVGGLVSLYRGCKHNHDGNENHYYVSHQQHCTWNDNGTTCNTDDESHKYRWMDINPPIVVKKSTTSSTTSIVSIDNKFDHYYQSYGVDSNDWFLQI